MSISKYLTESIFVSRPLDEPLFIIEKGFKGWLSTVNKVLSKVPKEAIPEKLFETIENLGTHNQIKLNFLGNNF